MRSFESNLAFVQACLAEMRDYERAEPLFWTLSVRSPAGSPPFLQMTIGNLVLALDEMRAVEGQLDPGRRDAYARVHSKWETRWAGRTARLEAKARAEVASRVGQWRAYVSEVTESSDLGDYPSAIRPRLCAARLIDLLGPSLEGMAEISVKLGALDARLDPQTEEGPCALGAQMAAIYPPLPGYRFLYRRAAHS